MNPFDDPALAIFVVQQLVCNRLLDKIITVMTSSILWKPKNNSLFRVFSRSVSIALRRKDAQAAQEKYRTWFFNRNTSWLVSRMSDIFTPRAREQYRSHLSMLYQNALQLQPAQIYKAPGEAFPVPVAQEELPENLRRELEDNSDDEGEHEHSPFPALPPPAGGGPGGALEHMQLPSLPQLGPGPGWGPSGVMLPAPPALPDYSGAWDVPRPPYIEGGEEEATELPSQYGTLAKMIGKAWLATAKRRIDMQNRVEALRKLEKHGEKCDLCGVNDDDPFVQEGLGIWKHGAKLHTIIGVDLSMLIHLFEEHHGVPRMPYEEAQWDAWLRRNNAFQTVCLRCDPSRNKKSQPGSPLSVLSPTSPGLPVPKRRISSPTSDSNAMDGEFDDDADEEDDEEHGSEDEHDDHHDDHHDGAQMGKDLPGAARFGGVGAEVTHAQKEMLLYWSMVARRHLKARKRNAAMLARQQREAEEEEAELRAEAMYEEAPATPPMRYQSAARSSSGGPSGTRSSSHASGPSGNAGPSGQLPFGPSSRTPSIRDRSDPGSPGSPGNYV
jgi:hypothetical protein